MHEQHPCKNWDNAETKTGKTATKAQQDLFVTVCSHHSWADPKLLVECTDQGYLEIQDHPSWILVRKNQSWDVWKERRSPSFGLGFALEGQME